MAEDGRSLDGKVALVTGAAGGIGRATSCLFAARGAIVVVADIDAARAREVASDIAGTGGTALAVELDVSQESQVEDALRITDDEFGRLDVVFNNAAAVSAEQMDRDHEVTAQDVAVWDRALAVNLRGPMLCTKHAVPRMIRGGGGAIINVSSGAAEEGDMIYTAYAASKAAVVTLTFYTAAQYGRDGIRCNVLMPVASGYRPPDERAHVPDGALERVGSYSITGRHGDASDVAKVVAFLASDDAAWVTGAVIRADGGFHLPSYRWPILREAYESRRLGQSAT